MSIIIDYAELAGDALHALGAEETRMVDFFSAKSMDNKEAVIDYLINAGEIEVATTAGSNDVFTGEPTGYRDNLRNDGVYSWPVAIAYYVDKYNLVLPDDFTRHILDSIRLAKSGTGS